MKFLEIGHPDIPAFDMKIENRGNKHIIGIISLIGISALTYYIIKTKNESRIKQNN